MKKATLNHVRKLRKNTTETEKYLWHHLRARRLNHYKFRRQYLIYPYVVDFICLSHKLIVECDGSQHQAQEEYDQKRTNFLTTQGYRVMRFWNNEIFRETSLVLNIIVTALEEKEI